MASPPIKFTQRQQFIDALEARRAWAKAYDKHITAKHKEDERAALEKVRAQCRELLKMSYADIKERDGRRTIYVSFDAPSCPSSAVASLDRALTTLNLSHQETFTVDSDGAWRSAYWLLTHDENAHRDVC